MFGTGMHEMLGGVIEIDYKNWENNFVHLYQNHLHFLDHLCLIETSRSWRYDVKQR